MYHIVFNSPRHRQTSYYVRNKTNKSSTFNQFELETIRASIKSRWALHGYGHLDVQKHIWNVEDKAFPNNASSPSRQLNGHIITVETPADVIWFRMNAEHVAKHGCKMTEIYKDLDLDLIQDISTQVSALKAKQEAQTYAVQYTGNAYYSMSRFSEARTESYIDQEDMDTSAKFIKELTNFQSFLNLKVNETTEELKILGNKLKDHLKTHRTEIS